jgi:hypothetical protein
MTVDTPSPVPFERWLREEVVPTFDATMADPSSRIPAKAAFAEARARRRELGTR